MFIFQDDLEDFINDMKRFRKWLSKLIDGWWVLCVLMFAFYLFWMRHMGVMG